MSVSVNDSDRGCVVRIFVGLRKTVLAANVEDSVEQWWPTSRQKRLYLHHQGEFQHNFVSLHHSDHDGVVRIFVGHSEVVKRLLIN